MRKLKGKKKILSAVMTVCKVCSVFVGVIRMRLHVATKYKPLKVSSGYNYDVLWQLAVGM